MEEGEVREWTTPGSRGRVVGVVDRIRNRRLSTLFLVAGGLTVVGVVWVWPPGDASGWANFSFLPIDGPQPK